MPCASMPDAYGKLGKLLPNVKIDAQSTRDFLYRINRRRVWNDGSKRLKINRLSTWSALEFIDVSFDFSLESLQISPIEKLLNSSSICRLEFDINTVPESRTAPEIELMPPIYNELVKCANQIATNGDIP